MQGGKRVVSAPSDNSPPPMATLNFTPDISETEKAIKEKFNNSKVLPNYTKNPELELEQTLLKLRGNEQIEEFKKDVPVAPQRQQPTPSKGNEKTIPPEFLKKHLDEMAQKKPEEAETTGIQKMVPPQMNCKFLSSSKCHPDYPKFSGASINFQEGSKLKCDSMGNEKPAKAVSTISGGQISGVYLIDGGEGYESNPKIEAIGGGGEGAELNAVVENGKIKDIKVINGGHGFHETPVIKIETPNLSNGCYLCCK